MDLYSNSIAVSLNIKNAKTIHNVVLDITDNKFKDLNDYLFEYNKNIKVLTSVNDPRIGSQIETRYISQIINIMKHSFDVVLIDTNHVLTELNLVVYDNSDTIVNVMTNDPVDLVNTKNLINIVSEIEFPDLRILLNESNNLEEKYFSLYDIREFLGVNVPYRLGREFYVKTIDKYVLDGKILTLLDVYKKDYKKIENIAFDLIKDFSNN